MRVFGTFLVTNTKECELGETPNVVPTSQIRLSEQTITAAMLKSP